MVYGVLLTLIYAGFSNMLPAILAYRGVSVEVIGAIYSLEKALVLTLSMVMLTISTRQAVFYMMPLILILYASLIVAFVLIEDPLTASVLVPLITGAFMSLRPLNRALVNILVDVRLLGLVSGLLNSVALLTSTISTATYGLLLRELGLRNSILVLLTLMIPTLATQLLLVSAVPREVTQYKPGASNLVSLLRGARSVFLEPLLLVLSLTELVEGAIAVYISVILWNLLKDFAIVGLALSAAPLANLVLSPVMGYISDKISRPLELIGVSLCILAVSYYMLSLSYTYTPLAFVALILSGVAPSIFTPNLQLHAKSLKIQSTTYFTALEFLSSITGILSPLIAAMVIARTGFETFLALYAIGELLVSLTLLAIALRRKAKSRSL
jgi:predicted MFS family arabinose efflux permease